MAGDDTHVRTEWNLDAREALETLSKLKNGIASLSAKENLAGLIDGLAKASLAIGALGIAAFSIKKTFDLVFDAEEIKSVNLQFEILTKNAGISGNALKEGLEKASGGLVDTTDQLKIANKAIVTLGASAEKLPQIMEMARKIGVIAGKDTATAFEELTHAIEIGSQRMLRQLNINIDVEKATKKYAESLHIAVNELSEAGKRQAVLNEVLEKGGKDLSGIDTNIKEATNTWQQIKVTLKDASENIALAFEKVAGPAVKEFLKLIKQGATDFRGAITGDWGNATETLKHRSSEIITEMTRLETNISELQEQVTKGIFPKEEADQDIDAYRKRLNLLDMELKGVQEQLKNTKEATIGWHVPMALPEGENKANPDEQLKNAAKFAQQMSQIDKSIIDERIKNITDEQEIDDLFWRKELSLTNEYSAKIEAVKAEYATRPEMRRALELELAGELQQKLLDLQINLENERVAIENKAFENREKTATGFFNKFSAGAKKSAHDGQTELKNWAKLGETTTQSFASNFTNAFEEVGRGSIDVGNAIKKATLGSIGDVAVAQGSKMLLEGLWPPNPLELAAGAGLVALGGYLKGAAGGAGSISAQGGGGAGGGFGGTSGGIQGRETFNTREIDSETQANVVAQSAVSRRSTTLIINGNVFETEQFRTRLVDIIREAGDTTDFRIQAIGGGLGA